MTRNKITIHDVRTALLNFISFVFANDKYQFFKRADIAEKINGDLKDNSEWAYTDQQPTIYLHVQGA